MLRREHIALDRDVIFLAVADEEAGGTARTGSSNTSANYWKCRVPGQ